jgi:uncharacterized membrane protein
MVANVFRVIIPAQKDLVNAVTENRVPDAGKARKALQRSRHNNYFTLPVLFIMLSGHFPSTYKHPHSWLVLLLLSLAAVAVRHYFNIRHLPGFRAWPLFPAALLLAGVIFITVPEPASVDRDTASTSAPSTGEIYAIIETRCSGCHARVPTMAGFTSAPLGVELDSPQKLLLHADRVYQTAVITGVMPLANLTQMTDTERHLLARWFEEPQESVDQ